MKNCTHCKYADWKRTAAGRLHPDGSGKCTFPWKMPPLPAAFYWLGAGQATPYGGFIERKREHKEHCPHYQPEQRN
jgi:hypothetical protein